MNSVRDAERGRRLGNRPEENAAQASEPKRWDCISDWARARGEGLLTPVIRALQSLGVHPNTVTLLGLLMQAGVATVIGLGYLTLGGWLLLVVAPVDALDGALARANGQPSRFGALLDSTLDRVADAVLVLGLLVYYLRQEATLQVALLLVSLVAAMLVSYIRARAEALGFSCKVGLLSRLERIVLIGLLLGVGLPSVLVWALAVLSVFTVLQRIAHVYVLSRLDEPSE